MQPVRIERSEDTGARFKLPQPSQEEEVLVCLLQHCICVSRPCEILGDVNAEELKAVYPLLRCLVDGFLRSTTSGYTCSTVLIHFILSSLCLCNIT